MRKTIIALTCLVGLLVPSTAHAADLRVVGDKETSKRILIVGDFIKTYDSGNYLIKVKRGVVTASRADTGALVKSATLVGGKYAMVEGSKNDKYTPPSRLGRIAWLLRVNTILKFEQGNIIADTQLINEFIGQYDMAGFSITSDGKKLTAKTNDGLVVETVSLEGGTYKKVSGADNDVYTPRALNIEKLIATTS